MPKKTKHFILALETSCDETAAAVLEIDDKHRKIKTLSSIVKSQITIHKKFGGVFPEAAARAHIKNIRPVAEKALKDAWHNFHGRENYAIDVLLSKIDYIAVTVGPGLNPSLLVGVEFAKGLSYATGKPIIPVNHLAGHLYSPFRREFSISNFQFSNIFPSISLIVSGGHTMLVLSKNLKDYKILGQTLDDAAGEAFDKIARLLGLPYPGGPELSKLAENGNPKAIDFPRPMLNKKNYNFSFSGLKTSVLYYLRDNPLTFPRKRESRKIDSGSPSTSFRGGRNDIAASVQQAIIDVLVGKTLRAAKEYNAKSIAISGGVSANKVLRKTLNRKSKILNLNFFMPPVKLSTDNAEMIGLAAGIMLKNGFKPVNYKKIDAQPNLKLK